MKNHPHSADYNIKNFYKFNKDQYKTDEVEQV